MQLERSSTAKEIIAILCIAVILVMTPGTGFSPSPAYAQSYLPPVELDRLVSRIALYPDPLLVQVLTAATYPDQISVAAQWAVGHGYMHGDQLARAMADGQFPWDPSVQSLLPVPSVLDMMARDMGWTSELGNAFLAQRNEVMDAVQRMRRRAWNYGYLRSNRGYRVVNDPGYIEIDPVTAGYYYVPRYDPFVVYAPPRPGFGIGTAIVIGSVIVIGGAFAAWGWGHSRFGWRSHAVYVDNHAWGRTWGNRTTYVHPYAAERFRQQRGFEGQGLRREGEHRAGAPAVRGAEHREAAGAHREAEHRAGTPANRGPEHQQSQARSQSMQQHPAAQQHQATGHGWAAPQQHQQAQQQRPQVQHQAAPQQQHHEAAAPQHHDAPKHDDAHKHK